MWSAVKITRKDVFVAHRLKSLIAAEIGQRLEDFGIKGKVGVVTTDDAKAMTNAATTAGIRLSLNCFAHILNLSTQKVMSVSTVISMLAII
ncbi:Hypp6545 [Branchiostoma lanceolatum]|uniref:Hypp6545 protein n=1 Tax=Branchiostoma lanceolatum TaxID=7740 RepID=A0A8J9YV54_BRALA|nr:Hypp6545 [Branchiostoma lanceolatum]